MHCTVFKKRNLGQTDQQLQNHNENITLYIQINVAGKNEARQTINFFTISTSHCWSKITFTYHINYVYFSL